MHLSMDSAPGNSASKASHPYDSLNSPSTNDEEDQDQDQDPPDQDENVSAYAGPPSSSRPGVDGWPRRRMPPARRGRRGLFGSGLTNGVSPLLRRLWPGRTASDEDYQQLRSPTTDEVGVSPVEPGAAAAEAGFHAATAATAAAPEGPTAYAEHGYLHQQRPHRRWHSWGSLVDVLRAVSSFTRSILLIFVPIGLATYVFKASPTLIFVSNALAIVPLSALLTDATERIASEVGDTIGALLNISLGNLVELILFVALIHKQIRVVQASILGSILVNLLLILGSALLAGGLLNHELVHNATETQLLASLLYVSVFTFLMPTAFDYTYKHVSGADGAVLHMSRISALLVLVVYIIYFVHQLRSINQGADGSVISRDVESGLGGSSAMADSTVPLIHSRSLSMQSLVLPPRTIRFADEGSRRGTAVSSEAASKADNPIELDRISGFEHQHESGDETGDTEDDGDIVSSRGRRSGSTAAMGATMSDRVAVPPRSVPGVAAAISAYPHMFHARRHSRSISLSSSRGGGRLSREFSADNIHEQRRGVRGVAGAAAGSGAVAGAGAGTGGQGGIIPPAGLAPLTPFQMLRDYATAEQQLHHHQHQAPPHHHRPPSSSSSSMSKEPGGRHSFAGSIALLVAASFLMSMCAEFLVSTIDDVVDRGHLSESLIGLIILPVVGNISEYVTVVTVAARDKMDLAIAVSVGSSVQIALCLTPLTVLAGWALDRGLALTFNFFELATLLGTVLLVNFLILNGRTTGLKGSLMCSCYVIIGLGAYLSPAT